MASLKAEEKKLNYRPRSPNIDRKRPHRNVEVCTMGAIEIIGISHYYTSREFSIQNFNRRTTDILYHLCNSNGEYCHSFAIAAGDSRRYQLFIRCAKPMHVRLVHVRRRSTAMADMRLDLATFNSQLRRCLWSET